jgi:hypothetical protein
LARGELASRGVERQAALSHDLREESLGLALAEEAEILELDEHDGRVVVVDDRKIHVLRAGARLVPERASGKGEARA